MLLGNRELPSQLRMIIVEMSPPASVSRPCTRAHTVPNTPPIIVPLSSLAIAIAIQLVFANPALPGDTEFCSDIFQKNHQLISNTIVYIFFTLARPPGQLEAVFEDGATRAHRISQHHRDSGCNISKIEKP